MEYGDGAYEVELSDMQDLSESLVTLKREEFVVIWQESTGANVPVAEQVAQWVAHLPNKNGQEILNFARFLSVNQKTHAVD